MTQTSPSAKKDSCVNYIRMDGGGAIRPPNEATLALRLALVQLILECKDKQVTKSWRVCMMIRIGTKMSIDHRHRHRVLARSARFTRSATRHGAAMIAGIGKRSRGATRRCIRLPVARHRNEGELCILLFLLLLLSDRAQRAIEARPASQPTATIQPHLKLWCAMTMYITRNRAT